MAIRRSLRRTPSQPKRLTKRAGSWMALLAATTLGVEGVGTVRAEVQADANLAESRDYRLVVQSFDGKDVPGQRVRPVGSYQRSITAAELRRGVRVNLVELRSNASAADGSIVAWIELGKPDLEFDGRTSRPLPGSMFGLAKRGAGESSVQIRLNRRAA